MYIVNTPRGIALREPGEVGAREDRIALDLGEPLHLHIAALVARAGDASPAADAEVEAVLASLGLGLDHAGALEHAVPAEALVHDDAAMLERMAGMMRVLDAPPEVRS